MADLVFNVAKGRVAELYNRVDSGDPSTARLKIVVFNITGGASAQDTALRDADTLAAIEAITDVSEVTNTGYDRKVLTSSDTSALSPDDTNDRMDLDIPDQTWTAVSSGDAWHKLVVVYFADGASGADSTGIPLTAHDFAVTPDGSDITAVINASGFFRAT